MSPASLLVHHVEAEMPARTAKRLETVRLLSSD